MRPPRPSRKSLFAYYKPFFGILIIGFIFLVQAVSPAYAATYTESQSTWSGGVSANTMVHPTNQTGWTNYASSTNISATSQSFQLNSSTNSYTENFSTQNYLGSVSLTPWYNAAWGYRQPVTINHAYVSGTSTLSNFPVLINVTNASFKDVAHGGHVGKSDGSDILFTSSDQVTKLDHEIESYVPSTGQIIAWVRIPSLSPLSDTSLYMYYGNASAADQSNAAGVWDSNYLGVWHLGDGSSVTTKDSTSHGFTLTRTGTPTVTTLNNLPAASTSLTSYLTSASVSSSLSSFTWSIWARSSQVPGATSPDGPLDGASFGSIWNHSDPTYRSGSYLRASNAGYYSSQYPVAELANTDYYLAGSFDGAATLKVYLNGALKNTKITGAGGVYGTSFPITIGKFISGGVAEARISNIVRSPDWIATEYNNQSGPSTFVSFGSEFSSASAWDTTARQLSIPSGFSNAVIQSQAVATSSIGYITLTKTDAVGSGSATYYVSNNGGSTFNQVTPGSVYTFGTAGNDLRWKVSLSGNATVSSVTLVWGASLSGELDSSPYNTGQAGDIVSKISWTATGTSTNDTVKFQIRIAPDNAGAPGTWSNWCGYADTGSSCTGTNYFDYTKNGVVVGGTHPFTLGTGAQWFQYRALLQTAGSFSAQVTGVTMTYVINAAPEFNPDYPVTAAGGITASQIATSTDPNYGQVSISYSIRDSDATSGSVTPGFITPTIQYNIGSGWVAIPAQYLETNALSNKAVSESTYTPYTSYWNAKAQLGSATFSSSARIRVTINDNEAANNTATDSSGNFTLDTKATVSTIILDASNGLLSATSTDDSLMQYELSNNTDGSSDGANAISGNWINPNSATVATSTAWTFSSSTYPTVYLLTKDLYNNTSTLAAVAPATESNVEIHDVSNVSTGIYKEFVSWGPYTATSSAAFAKYNLYRSNDGTNYSLLTSITDSATNYYVDATVASSTTYSYKLTVVDTDGDTSAYSAVVSDQPNGQGGTDSTAPVITNVSVGATQSTWATITWTTDELANSIVDYSTSAGVYSSSQTSNSYLTAHSIRITGLTPNTTYYFRVKSSDAAGNVATNDNGGSGYSFSTESGPTISLVTATPSENQAVITWTTVKSADSYVFYSTSGSMTGVLTVGSAGMVATSTDGSTFNHSVTLTGLSSGQTYYYYVQSTDADGNTATADNNGTYYSFQTSTDTTAPVISGVDVPVTTDTQAAVVWTTDEPATSQVSYGTESGSYSTDTTEDDTFTVSHMVSLSHLTAATKYYFIVTSRDAAGNIATSTENTFTASKGSEIVYIGGGGGGGSVTQVVPDTTAPAISNIATASGTLTSFGITITFTTNEDALGIVEFGPTDKYGLASAETGFAQQHTVVLSGLRMGTKYHYHVLAIDKAGNQSHSDDDDFITKYLTDDLSNVKVDDLYQYQDEIENQIASILPSIVPPFIGKVDVSNVTENSADASWQTNIKAFSAIQYATDDQYRQGGDNPYPVELGNTNDKVQDHALSLVGLQPNTKYHMRIKAYNFPQAASFSKDITFTTKASDINAYVAEVKINSFRVTWSTPDPSDSIVEYKNMTTGEINRKVDEQKKTFHEMIIDNVPAGTTFQVKASSVNGKGNLMTTKQAIKVTTGIDQTAPVVTGLKIENTLVPGSADKVQTLVRWVTDEPATTVVYYEEGSGQVRGDHLANKVGDDQAGFVTDHVAVIGSLKAGSIYRIQIESADQAGNKTISSIKTIVVPKQSQSISDVIFKNFEDSFKFLQK